MVIKWSDNIQIGRFPQWRIFYILKLVANQKRHSFGDVHTVKKKLFPKPECHLSPGVATENAHGNPSYGDLCENYFKINVKILMYELEGVLAER